MKVISIEDLNVKLPNSCKAVFIEEDFNEWFICQISKLRVPKNNPLRNLKLEDCVVTFGPTFLTITQ